MIALGTGLIVALVFGALLGMPFGLAATNGLAAGMLAWAAYFQLRNWSFLVQLWTPKSNSHRAVVLYAALLILVASSFSNDNLQSERAVEIGFQLLFLLVGFTVFQLGSIVSIIDLTDDRGPSIWGIRTAKGPVLTALSTVVAFTTGLIAAAALGSWLETPWELAVMNGLAVGTTVAAFAFAIRTSQLGVRPTHPVTLPPWVGVIFAGQFLIIVGPSVFAYVEADFAVGLGLYFLFLTTGFAAMALGMIAGSLGHTDAVEVAGARGSLSATPPSIDGGNAS